ncbi:MULTISPECIES: plasmid mobilization protein [unclassified Vibrio]|uniref:plasmid mobilization protein n=1 Tax=unclassified Vibrio TaxID=2614977 RepID=UPI00354E1FD4
MSKSKSKKPVRHELIQIRVTADEKSIIQTNAKGNISDWFRTFALDPKSPHHKPAYKEFKQDPELVQQVALLGNNINQLTRQVNTIKKQGSRLDLVAVQARLAETNELLSQLIKLGA